MELFTIWGVRVQGFETRRLLGNNGLYWGYIYICILYTGIYGDYIGFVHGLDRVSIGMYGVFMGSCVACIAAVDSRFKES